MSNDEYVPSDDQVRGRYCDGTYVQTGHTTVGDGFDAWLARVKRDAAREALAGMASAHTGAFMEEDRPSYRHEHNIAAQAADNYMRAHYPEETP